MALTSASDIAVAAFHRAAAGVRTVTRAIVRRSDAWLYGLDQEYPEYDAYRRRPRRIARAVGITMRCRRERRGRDGRTVWRAREPVDTTSTIRQTLGRRRALRPARPRPGTGAGLVRRTEFDPAMSIRHLVRICRTSLPIRCVGSARISGRPSAGSTAESEPAESPVAGAASQPALPRPTRATPRRSRRRSRPAPLRLPADEHEGRGQLDRRARRRALPDPGSRRERRDGDRLHRHGRAPGAHRGGEDHPPRPGRRPALRRAVRLGSQDDRPADPSQRRRRLRPGHPRRTAVPGDGVRTRPDAARHADRRAAVGADRGARDPGADAVGDRRRPPRRCHPSRRQAGERPDRRRRRPAPVSPTPSSRSPTSGWPERSRRARTTATASCWPRWRTWHRNWSPTARPTRARTSIPSASCCSRC